MVADGFFSLPSPWDEVALSDGYLKCDAKGKMSLALCCSVSTLGFVLGEILQGVLYREILGMAVLSLCMAGRSSVGLRQVSGLSLAFCQGQQGINTSFCATICFC